MLAYLNASRHLGVFFCSDKFRNLPTTEKKKKRILLFALREAINSRDVAHPFRTILDGSYKTPYHLSFSCSSMG
jgi:hypothetical protein